MKLRGNHRLKPSGTLLGPLLGLTAFLYLLLMPSVSSRLVDFPVYYEAGIKALSHQTVYDVVGHFQYKYSPVVAYAFGLLFGSFSLEEAATLWHRCSLLGIFSIFLLWARALIKVRNPSQSSFGLALFVFAFFFGAIKLELQLGQLNFLPVGLMSIFLISSERRTSWLNSGAMALAMVLATHLKLYALCLLFIPFYKKDWRFFLAFLSLGFISLWPTMELFHSKEFAHAETQAWIASLTASTQDLLTHPQNVGWSGFLAKMIPYSFWSRLLWCLLLAAYIWVWFKNRRHPYSAFFYGTSIIVLLNPLVWSYWVWFLAPAALVVLYAQVYRKKNRSLAWYLGAILIWLSFHAQSAALNWNYGLVFSTTLLFLAAHAEIRQLQARI